MILVEYTLFNMSRGIIPSYSSALSLDQAFDLVGEFLEAAIHSLLCERNMYPMEAVETTVLYGRHVFRNRHPGVQEYIHRAVSQAVTWARASDLDKLAVVFLDANNEAFERYVFIIRPAAQVMQQGNTHYFFFSFFFFFLKGREES